MSMYAQDFHQLLVLLAVFVPLHGLCATDAELAQRAHQYYEEGNTYYQNATDANMARAMSLYLKGMRLAEEAQDDSALGRGNYLIGAIYDNFYKIDKAKAYYSKALRHFEKINARDWTAQCYYALAVMQMKPLEAAERNVDSALIYFRIAERIAREDKNYPLLIEIHKESAITGVKQDPPDLQLASRNIDSLNSVYRQMRSQTSKRELVNMKIKLLEATLLYHEKLGNQDSVGYYLNALLQKSKGVNFQMQRLYLTEMAQYKREIGQLDSAYIYLDSSMKVTVKYHDLRSRELITELVRDNALQEKEARIAQQETRLRFNRFFLITALVVGGILGVTLLFLYRSFRARTQMNASLKQSEQEKTTLLQELHHRVKNNLQMLNTLLMLQSRKLNDPTAKAAVMESRARVETMSLAHRKLYDDKALTNVNLEDYLKELIQSLTDTYLTEHANVRVSVEKRWCSADYAIPIGLIVNELVTNSIKHARPESGRLSIQVEIRQPTLNDLQLIYQDNGTGMSSQENLSSNSLGLRLIELMTAQLKGEFKKEGSRWKFDFQFVA